jgi:hypothetical protein
MKTAVTWPETCFETESELLEVCDRITRFTIRVDHQRISEPFCVLVRIQASSRAVTMQAMFKFLQDTLLRWSNRWWMIVLFAALTFITVFVFRQVGEEMKALIGFLPFDLQTPITLEQVQSQLPAYTDASRNLYARFLAWDYLFPLFVSITLCLILARSLTTFYKLRSQTFTGSWLILVPLNAAVMDWLENILFALTVWVSPAWAPAAVLVKSFKVIFSVIISSSGVLIFALAMLVASGLQRRRNSRSV